MADVAQQLLELNCDITELEEGTVVPDEVIAALILGGDDVAGDLGRLIEEKRTEAGVHRRWIAIAKRRGCYRDYTILKDRIKAAVDADVRLPPESYIDEVDVYTRRLIVMCKVSETGRARTYVENIFSRRSDGNSNDEDKSPRRIKIFGRRKKWED